MCHTDELMVSEQNGPRTNDPDKLKSFAIHKDAMKTETQNTFSNDVNCYL